MDGGSRAVGCPACLTVSLDNCTAASEVDIPNAPGKGGGGSAVTTKKRIVMVVVQAGGS